MVHLLHKGIGLGAGEGFGLHAVHGELVERCGMCGVGMRRLQVGQGVGVGVLGFLGLVGQEHVCCARW